MCIQLFRFSLPPPPTIFQTNSLIAAISLLPCPLAIICSDSQSNPFHACVFVLEGTVPILVGVFDSVAQHKLCSFSRQHGCVQRNSPSLSLSASRNWVGHSYVATSVQLCSLPLLPVRAQSPRLTWEPNMQHARRKELIRTGPTIHIHRSMVCTTNSSSNSWVPSDFLLCCNLISSCTNSQHVLDQHVLTPTVTGAAKAPARIRLMDGKCACSVRLCPGLHTW